MSQRVCREHIVTQRGYLALQSPGLDALVLSTKNSLVSDQAALNRRNRDGSHYHMTLVSKQELQMLSSDHSSVLLLENSIAEFLVGEYWLPLGVGQIAGCTFLVVAFPHANALRRKLGLAQTNFHVTLGFEGSDQHKVSKGVETIQNHHYCLSSADICRWLDLAKCSLKSIRRNETSQLGLVEVCDLLRALTNNLVTTQPDAIATIEQAVLCWCRAAGRSEDFSQVIDAAQTLLSVEDRIASAWGYMGCALFKLRRYDEALPALEKAKELFGPSPPSKHQPQAYAVEDCIVICCSALGRDPPLPPLVKFPRTAHLFRPQGSKAIAEDDEVLPKDSAMLSLMNDGETVVTLQEKVDGANLGISLSWSGRDILAQNRSHYIHGGDHPQYGPLSAWIEMHREALLQILDSPSKRTSRHGWILYGEWLVACHSIPYHKLPGYFVAFDLYNIANKRFVSQERLHATLRGSGIPWVPCLGQQTFGSNCDIQSELMHLLGSESRFRKDGGKIEGIVFRIDKGDWLLHRSKLVCPDFVAGCADGHWSKRKIEKQIVDLEFAEDYMESCFHNDDEGVLPCAVKDPRERAVVVYKNESETPQIRVKIGTHISVGSGRREVMMPRNLSWLWPGEVAVSSTPKSAEQIQAFCDALGIGLVITLTKEEPLKSEWFSKACQNRLYPIPNYHAPTLTHMDDIGDEIVRSLAVHGAVLEHCRGGKGRAGTVAACLLLRFGRNGIRDRIRVENLDDGPTQSLLPRVPFLTSAEAVTEIRSVRPGSIETETQEAFVREYAQHLWRRAAEFEDIWSDDLALEDLKPSCTSKTLTRTTKTTTPKYIVLMGLPGSSKSTFAHHLARAFGYEHANQDEMGHRSCVDFVGRMSASVGRGERKGLIVDCTNVTASHRREWLRVMHEPQGVALVVFEIPVDVSVARVAARVNHPTIPFGRGERIVRGFAKQWEPTTEEERSRFSCVHILRSRSDTTRLLNQWGVHV